MNAKNFFEQVKEYDAGTLSETTKFAVFGLGDTGYV